VLDASVDRIGLGQMHHESLVGREPGKAGLSSIFHVSRVSRPLARSLNETFTFRSGSLETLVTVLLDWSPDRMVSRPMASGDRDAPRVDDAAECIWRDGEKVGVPPKAFLVLRRLMERPGQLVTKSDLLDTVWPGTFVTETVLNNAVAQIRQALGDDPRQARFIETVHRRGFRWIGPSQAAPPTASVPVESQAGLEAAGTDEFVGRSESIAELARCFALAAAGRRQLVFVTGEPGIGKSALVEGFLLGLEAKTATAAIVGRGQCIEAYGVGDHYRPVREAVEHALQRDGNRIVDAFRRHAPSWLLSMPELSSAAELEELRRSVVAATSDSVQRELERAIEAASAERTIVLVLEDLHWSDPATVALLWSLAARREPARLLIIGTYRSVDAIAQQHPIIRVKHELATRRQCVELVLEGLPTDTVASFLDLRFPGHRFPSGLAMRLGELSAGNPLFLLNALADFEHRGWLREKDGAWCCTADLDSIAAAVPDSTRELIGFRLDQLPATTRLLLEAASIVGTGFAAQAVAAAEERSCTDVEAELEPLARAEHFVESGDEIVWPDGTRGCEYRFRHALYRQILSRRVTPARRQLLHRRIACALESAYGERNHEIAGPLSLHFEQAGDAIRAADYIDILAKQAYARSAAHEAESMYRHAVTLLKSSPSSSQRQERLLKSITALAVAMATVHGLDSKETVEVWEEAREIGRSVAKAPEYVASLSAIIVAKSYMGQLREALGIAQELLLLGASDASPITAMTAHMSMGQSLMYLGEIEPALAHLERAVASIDHDSPDAVRLDASGFDLAVPVTFSLGWCLILAGDFVRGRELTESAIRMARAKQQPFYLVYLLTIASMLAVVRRDAVDARRFAAEALTHGEENGLPYGREMSRAALGWAEVCETLDPKALEPMREAVGILRGTGVLPVSRACGIFADACLAIGRLDDAGEAIAAAFETRGEARFYDAEFLRQRAAILLARAAETGTHSLREQAGQVLEQAVALAHSQGSLLFELRATIDLCRVWLADGKRDEARARLEAVVARVRSGSDETDMRDARALLEDSAMSTVAQKKRAPAQRRR
jgi:DNA-binding winged helix-turn-helix (wHTH) protein/tetratricopeptide (TPR) repeat protein